MTFSHTNSDLPFPPSSESDEGYTWRWDEIFDTGVDISIELEELSYVGAVCFSLKLPSASRITVLVDGAPSGYRAASEGSLIGGSVSIPIGAYGRSVILRIFTDLEDLTVGSVEILGSCGEDEPFLWPTPRSLSVNKGEPVKIADIVSATDDPDEIFAAEFLRESLAERFDFSFDKDGETIVIKKTPYEGDRYTVKRKGGVTNISGAKRISLLYGASALISMAERDGVRPFEVDDAPSMPLRGFHFGLPHKDKINFTRRLLRYVLLPMRYNVIFLEFAGGMRFDRHPEISEGWLSAIENAKAGKQPFMPHSDKVSNRSLIEKDDVRLLVSYIKELGFALIPEVQSLAHVQYITYAHPEIAELDEKVVEVDVRRGADARPESFYAHSYCPSNEKSYEIIFDIIDEIVDLTEPDGYVHIGHDEVYQIGLCEKCRNSDPAELFEKHVVALYTYLKKKGLSTMMWSDMLHPEPITDYPTAKARKKLPRDIIMLDFIWYFHPERDIEDELLECGYRVCIGNLYSSHYRRFSSRIKKTGMIGGEVSSWLITDEDILARNGKLWDIMYLSEMLWNADGYNEKNRKSYNNIIAKYIQPKARDGVRQAFAPYGYSETELDVNAGTDTPSKELLAIFPNAKSAEGIHVDVSEKYDRLIFEHMTENRAARIVWRDNAHIGDYVIEYKDGVSVRAPVCYGDGVLSYNSSYAMPKHQQYYRHFGYVGTWFADPIYEKKDSLGADVLAFGYVFENPRPDVEIKSISYERDKNDFCRLALLGIKGLRKNKKQ